jgi:hypothetical protein
VRRRHRHDRQPAGGQQLEAGELRRVLAQLAERDDALQMTLVAHVDQRPARLFLRRFLVVVIRLRIELRRIGVGQARDLGDAGDARHFAARVIEEGEIAGRHLADEIARLEIAHAVPRLGLFRPRFQIVDAEGVRLGFHQPIFHRFLNQVSPRSVTTPSSRRSH